MCLELHISNRYQLNKGENINLLLDKYLKNNIQDEEILTYGRVRDIVFLTYNDALEISTKLIDDVIDQNYEEIEMKNEISHSKHSGSINELTHFNSKLHNVKHQLKTLFDAPNKRRIERIMENKGK